MNEERKTFWIDGYVPDETEICPVNEGQKTFTVKPIGELENKEGKVVKTCVQVVPSGQE